MLNNRIIAFYFLLLVALFELLDNIFYCFCKLDMKNTMAAGAVALSIMILAFFIRKDHKWPKWLLLIWVAIKLLYGVPAIIRMAKILPIGIVIIDIVITILLIATVLLLLLPRKKRLSKSDTDNLSITHR